MLISPQIRVVMLFRYYFFIAKMQPLHVKLNQLIEN